MPESALSFDLADAATTENFGGALARAFGAAGAEPAGNDAVPSRRAIPIRDGGDSSSPLVIHLHGDLGAGKTTWVRGFLRALGWQGTVRSPSYTLLEPYALQPWTCVHVDLYRLNAPADLEDLGLRDYLRAAHLLLIEWPEKGGAHTPPADLDIHMGFGAAGSAERADTDAGRHANLSANTVLGQTWLARFSGAGCASMRA